MVAKQWIAGWVASAAMCSCAWVAGLPSDPVPLGEDIDEGHGDASVFDGAAVQDASPRDASDAGALP